MSRVKGSIFRAVLPLSLNCPFSVDGDGDVGDNVILVTLLLGRFFWMFVAESLNW